MDETKYVELEAKYDASEMPVTDFLSAMRTLGGESKVVVGIDTFFSDGKKVLRFRRGRSGDVQNPVDKKALTYKKRRRNGDISDRTEIDLWLSNKATDQDAFAMMEAMGMHEAFSITKESWIQHVPDLCGATGHNSFEAVPNPMPLIGSTFGGYAGFGVNKELRRSIWEPTIPHKEFNARGFEVAQQKPPANRIDAVFALYDVLHEGKVRRFLEVEMERKGIVTAEAATQRLADWKNYIQKLWPCIGVPLNTSLYELYAPRNKLFVPESF